MSLIFYNLVTVDVQCQNISWHCPSFPSSNWSLLSCLPTLAWLMLSVEFQPGPPSSLEPQPSDLFNITFFHFIHPSIDNLSFLTAVLWKSCCVKGLLNVQTDLCREGSYLCSSCYVAGAQTCWTPGHTCLTLWRTEFETLFFHSFIHTVNYQLIFN